MVFLVNGLKYGTWEEAIVRERSRNTYDRTGAWESGQWFVRNCLEDGHVEMAVQAR